MKARKVVHSEKTNDVVTITLDRPDVLNALNRDLNEQLLEAFSKIENDQTVRCVVLRGNGNHFMAGGDLKSFSSELDRDSESRRQFFEKFVHQVHPLIQTIKRLPKPVIASVHGATGGFGMSLMLACDLVIAAENSFFTMAYCSIGTSPDGSSTYFLPRSVGVKKAMELALLCDRFDASSAKEMGIINWIVPPEQLKGETEKLSQRLASGPTKAYAKTKALINSSLESSLEQQLQGEAENFADCASTNDFVEGITAFLEKRAAVFTGT